MSEQDVVVRHLNRLWQRRLERGDTKTCAGIEQYLRVVTGMSPEVYAAQTNEDGE